MGDRKMAENIFLSTILLSAIGERQISNLKSQISDLRFKISGFET